MQQPTREAIRAVRVIRARAIENRRGRRGTRKPHASAINIVVAENDESSEVSDDSCCRFCFEENASDNHLTSPCSCIGSQRWVHEKCLSQWRSRWLPLDIRHTHCPVCLARFTTPAPTVLNLGQRQISCLSFTYATVLLVLNINVAIWFVFVECSSTRNRDFIEWCMPAVAGIGCCNGIVNSVATLHLRRRFRKIEVVIGVYFVLGNASSFCVYHFFNNYYLMFGTCFLSFLFAVCFVTHSFYRRLCGCR